MLGYRSTDCYKPLTAATGSPIWLKPAFDTTLFPNREKSGLGSLPEQPELVILDSFVWLGDFDRAGLGAHLYRALGERVAVVGVAKSLYAGAGPLREVLRGDSLRPLLVSAAGFDLDEAAARVRSMYGPHRLPTLLRLADQLSRP